MNGSDIAWRPTPEALAGANSLAFARAHGLDTFDELLARSIADPEWFWRAVIDHLGIEFEQPFTRVLDESDGMPWARWFEGGTLNLVHNCVDRHARTDRATEDAIRWEREDGSAGSLSYAELAAETSRCSGGLLKLGIRPGDRVGLVMPMIPEAIVGAYAIARIGAVCVPLFSGFSGAAMAARLHDCGAACVITAATMTRRGRVLPLAGTVVEACREVSSVRHVICLGDPGVAPTAAPWSPGASFWMVSGQTRRARSSPPSIR